MINWWFVTTSGVWILGLTCLVSALSYHTWIAGESGRARSDLWTESSFRLPWTAGVFFACVGWALAHARQFLLWEQVLWTSVIALFAWPMITALQGSLKNRHQSRRPPTLP